MVFYYHRSCDAIEYGLFPRSSRHFVRVIRDFFTGRKVCLESHDSQTSWTPEDHLRDQWCAEGQRMRLWAPRGHNCIYSDSTLGLWMHRCTVAKQCDLIATACATRTFVRYLYAKEKRRETASPPTHRFLRNRNVTLCVPLP